MSLVYLETQGHLAILTLTRPEKLNALNPRMLDDLDYTLTGIKAAGEIRVVIITGAGEKAFAAGADIRQFPALTPEAAWKFSRHGQAVFQKIEDLGKPVIAAVNGFALGGGCELALACHLRYAADSARFGQPEVGLGVIAGYGGTQRLPRLLGSGRALELLLSGRMLNASEALQIGLVNGVFPKMKLMEEVGAIARQIASKGPKALEYTLSAVNGGLSKSLEDGLVLEADYFKRVFETQDRVEGSTAFLEKRPPDFKGK